MRILIMQRTETIELASHEQMAQYCNLSSKLKTIDEKNSLASRFNKNLGSFLALIGSNAFSSYLLADTHLPSSSLITQEANQVLDKATKLNFMTVLFFSKILKVVLNIQNSKNNAKPLNYCYEPLQECMLAHEIEHEINTLQQTLKKKNSFLNSNNKQGAGLSIILALGISLYENYRVYNKQELNILEVWLMYLLTVTSYVGLLILTQFNGDDNSDSIDIPDVYSGLLVESQDPLMLIKFIFDIGLPHQIIGAFTNNKLDYIKVIFDHEHTKKIAKLVNKQLKKYNLNKSSVENQIRIHDYKKITNFAAALEVKLAITAEINFFMCLNQLYSLINKFQLDTTPQIIFENSTEKLQLEITNLLSSIKFDAYLPIDKLLENLQPWQVNYTNDNLTIVCDSPLDEDNFALLLKHARPRIIEEKKSDTNQPQDYPSTSSYNLRNSYPLNKNSASSNCSKETSFIPDAQVNIYWDDKHIYSSNSSTIKEIKANNMPRHRLFLINKFDADKLRQQPTALNKVQDFFDNPYVAKSKTDNGLCFTRTNQKDAKGNKHQANAKVKIHGSNGSGAVRVWLRLFGQAPQGELLYEAFKITTKHN